MKTQKRKIVGLYTGLDSGGQSNTRTVAHRHTHIDLYYKSLNFQLKIESEFVQEAQLSPSDRAMRLVSSIYLANCHATVQKLLIRQVLTKLMV